MWYNTENFFDPFHDSLKNDVDFLPTGQYRWTYSKYQDKIKNISRVIISLGGTNPPAIVGLGEIENDKCLNDLVNNSPLARLNYDYIHFESPDARGVDVALLFLKSKFCPIVKKPIRVNFPSNPGKKTRDILYVKGILDKADTLYIFLNHWPSRLGGEVESEEYRNFTAQLLKNKVDSLLRQNPNSLIILAGDFNDETVDPSIIEILDARPISDSISKNRLYNLSYSPMKKGEGTNKYKGKWSMIDQIMVSGNLLVNKSGLYTSNDDFHIFRPDFLLEQDRSNLGTKPFRTYNGFRYNNGFSDHLPVYCDLKKR